jgi:hypothetical protein
MPAERPWPAGVSGQPSREEFVGPAELRRTRPSRERMLAGKPGLAARTEAHPRPNRQPGRGRLDAPGAPEHGTSRGPTQPELAGKSLIWPRTKMLGPTRPESLYSSPQTLISARKNYILAGKVICRPGECRSRPPAHVCWPGHGYAGRDMDMPAGGSRVPARGRICRPGNVDVDPGQPYAGPGELMSAREDEEEPKCSEAVLMLSPRAEEEDPDRMYSYQRLDQPHGGRQMSSW